MLSWQRYRDFFGPDPQRDLADEVAFHLETETEALIAAGHSPKDARQQALTRFGDVERFLSECRASDARRLRRRRRARLGDVARQDFTHAIRGLLNRPAFAVTAILILALGVGANAAIFSVADHVFLRPPNGVRAPDEIRRIYVLRNRSDGSVRYQARFSLPEARYIDSAIRTGFPSTIWFRRHDVVLESPSGARRTLKAAWVSPSFFSVLGVRMFAGTDFDAESGRYGTPASSVIISWSLWQREFGGDASIVGRAVRLNGRPVTIRAIAPRGFSGLDVDAVELWGPLAGYSGFGERPGYRWYEEWGTIAFSVLARVPRASSDALLAARVEAGLAASADAFRATHPRPGRLETTPGHAIPGPILAARGPDGKTQTESIIAALAALALLLLVIAIANVGNLLLGRAIDRKREIAVRFTLGMSRARLVTQVAIESLILAVAATLTAGLAALWAGGLLRSMLLPGTQLATGPVDGRVAMLALVLAIGAGILAGIVPLGATFRLDLATALKTSVRDGGVRRSRARSALVTIQTALAVVLLVGTGLLGRSLYNVRTVHLGLDVGKLVSVINRDSAGDGRLRDVATLARTLPGVTGVALTSGALLDDMLGATHLFSRDGDTLRTVGSEVGYIAADPTFLDVVGTRVVRGRQFTADDRYGALPVMIVNEELARRVWPGRNAIGECLRIDRMERACYTVVGIAENAHSFYVIEEPKPVFYVPLAQHPERETTRDVIAGGLVARTDASPGRLASQLRAALRDTATAFRNQWVNVPTELLDQQYQPWVVGARLFAALAALALVLAIIGLYGVLSYLVAMRRHELGLRLALGAERGQMLGLVVREGIRQIAVGAVAGVVIASVTASRIASLLYGVSPRDPGVMLAALAVLAGCAFLAALVPARRAMTIDPMTAIRDE